MAGLRAKITHIFGGVGKLVLGALQGTFDS